jgi:beta-galactosidase
MNRQRAPLSLAACLIALAFSGYSGTSTSIGPARQAASPRTRLRINEDWRFIKGDPPDNKVSLRYDEHFQSEGAGIVTPWILPSGNDFLKDPAKWAKPPESNLSNDVAYIAAGFDDTSWRKVDLPHDYAVEGPFSTTGSGSMGRLPSPGTVWYRKNLYIPANDAGKSIFLDIDGAMSYSMVWLNGQFVGGWPYGYTSFRIDLTRHIKPGGNNVLAIRLDNPVPTGSGWQSSSSRWYPGAGLYRNVWLVKTAPVHVGQCSISIIVR